MDEIVIGDQTITGYILAAPPKNRWDGRLVFTPSELARINGESTESLLIWMKVKHGCRGIQHHPVYAFESDTEVADDYVLSNQSITLPLYTPTEDNPHGMAQFLNLRVTAKALNPEYHNLLVELKIYEDLNATFRLKQRSMRKLYQAGVQV